MLRPKGDTFYISAIVILMGGEGGGRGWGGALVMDGPESSDSHTRKLISMNSSEIASIKAEPRHARRLDVPSRHRLVMMSHAKKTRLPQSWRFLWEDSDRHPNRLRSAHFWTFLELHVDDAKQRMAFLVGLNVDKNALIFAGTCRAKKLLCLF